MSIYSKLARSVLLASLLVLGGCAGESPESVKLKEIAPIMHEKISSADKTQLQDMLDEIGPVDRGPVLQASPDGEPIEIDSNLIRAVVRQRLGQE